VIWLVVGLAKGLMVGFANGFVLVGLTGVFANKLLELFFKLSICLIVV
jgi:hypothetical protein